MGNVQESIDQLRERYAAFGQGHVFRFWDSLDAGARSALVAQPGQSDPPEPKAMRGHTRTRPAPGAGPPAPVLLERLPERGGSSERRAAARKRGEELLGSGRVGFMVVAGGQGTRLGFP